MYLITFNPTNFAIYAIKFTAKEIRKFKSLMSASKVILSVLLVNIVQKQWTL